MAIRTVLSTIFPLLIAPSLAACTPSSPSPLPVTFAAVLFPAFEPLDVFGPLDPLQIVSNRHHMNLHILSSTLSPLTAATQTNPQNSSWPLTVNPTMTFDDALASNLDIDVLIVPGGPGTRAPLEDLAPSIEFVRQAYPKVQYLISICTGASIVARSGVLDGKRATTNKRAWDFVTAFGPDVQWVSPARFVVDGNIWSSSGVTSGLDLIWAWMEHVYGEDLAYEISGMAEYEPHPATYDPFAERFGVPPSP